MAEWRVWKFSVPAPDTMGRAVIGMPAGANLLSVGMQGDAMVVWALVPDTAELERRRLIVANTGAVVPNFSPAARFLGTVDCNGVVWHVWDGDA